MQQIENHYKNGINFFFFFFFEISKPTTNLEYVDIKPQKLDLNLKMFDKELFILIIKYILLSTKDQ